MPFNPDKTEIMIFSNRSVPENLDFSFNGKSVPITTSHKHLGIVKCNTYVDNIKSSVSNRTNLDKLYLVYIRPLLEYACELLDNCGIGNSQKLEHLQLEAARIVTGLSIFTKPKFYIKRQVGNYYLFDGRERNFADDTSFGYSNQDTMQLKVFIVHDLIEMDIW